MSQNFLNSKEFENLKEYIQDKKKHILSLEYDWDDANGEIFNEETLNKVEIFLISYIKYMYETLRVVTFPKIYPSKNGSIDLQWTTEKLDLLINISSKETFSSFHFEDLSNQQTCEGTFNPLQYNLFLIPLFIEK